MELIDFPERTVLIAEDQPEYETLPAHRCHDEHGTIVCCWELSWKERFKILFSGVVWHQILTFNKSLQPQLLTIEKPDMDGE